MNIITIQNKEYIESDYVLTHAPIFSKGCRSSRDLIRKKNISNEHFIYARFDKNVWTITFGKSVKFDKVLILKSICDTIPELRKENDEIIRDDNGILKAPEILHLNDNEKFKDAEGNIIEIETRGEKKYNKIYFKIKDIEKGFGINNLNAVLTNELSNYLVNKDYEYFICEKILCHDKNISKSIEKTNKEIIKKYMFLTYEGLLRVLFTTKNNKTTPFIKWASEILFTVQIGNEIQKNTLISKMKGVSYSTIQELFNINASSVPCVYLTVFNTVSTLRTIMNIDDKYNDNDCVYKFGLTNSFEQRKNGHKSEYKEISDFIDFKLVQYAFIDPLYLSAAEKEISDLFKDNIFSYKNHNEIVILSEKEMKYIKNAFELIATKYSGRNSELLKEIDTLKTSINIINLECNQKIELMKKDTEILLIQKDNECKVSLIQNELDIYKKLCCK
jgi:hypothetical protein